MKELPRLDEIEFQASLGRVRDGFFRGPDLTERAWNEARKPVGDDKPMSGKTPSIGRIVHFTVENSVLGLMVVPAIITHVNDDGSLQLSVFLHTPGGEPRGADVIGMPRVEFSEAAAGTKEAQGRWSWPVYVP